MATEKRLIDANKLKDKLDSLEASGGHKYYRQGMDDTLHKFMPQILDDCPTVDAVEVTRCKECRDWYPNGSGCGNCKGSQWAIAGVCGPVTRADDFCSSGERRTDG